MNKLHAMNKIKFGERYTIYSPKDGQPCMDHDRSDGEGVGPQEYTGLKMELVQWGALAAPELDAKLQGKKIYFVAATLRPETMYGQTNCYVGPTIDYGAFQINDTDVYICTERAARNMAYQGTTKERGEVNKLASVKGSQLIGTKIKAPFGLYPEVYVLPMETVLATKVPVSSLRCLPTRPMIMLRSWTSARRRSTTRSTLNGLPLTPSPSSTPLLTVT